MSKSTRFLGGTPTTFANAFPTVKSISFVGEERGDTRDGGMQTRAVRYSMSDLPAEIRCSNPRCKQGGYDLNATIVEITSSKQTSYSVDWDCNGHEGTPKGRRRGDPCMNSLKFTIEVTYRD